MKPTWFAILLLAILAQACGLPGADPTPTPTAQDPLATATSPGPATTTPSPANTRTPSSSATPSPTFAPTLAAPPEGLDLQREAMRPPFRGDIDLLPDASWYIIEVDVGVDAAANQADLQGMARIRFTNSTEAALDGIPLMLWPNHEQYQGEMRAGPVLVDGAFVESELVESGIALWVALPGALEPGARLDLSLPFSVVDIGPISRERPQRFGLAEGVLLAPTFYPLIPRQVGGDWQTENAPPGGDTTNSDIAFYDVRITAPAGYQLVTSGVQVEHDSGPDEGVITRVVSGPVRDFAFALGPFEGISATVGGVEVRAWYLDAHAQEAQLMLTAAEGQLRTLSRLVGEYPYRELDLADGPGAFGGVEYPGLVFIGTLGTHWVVDPTVHEVTHQWFYALVGNDQLADPWLDEAFASYGQVLYYEQQVGSGRATTQLDIYREMLSLHPDPTIPVGLGVGDYESEGDYALFVYYKGALFLEALRREIGDVAFYDALSRYFKENRYAFGEPVEFQSAAEVACSCDLAALFQRWVYEGGELAGP
jgi:hypothetical protein